MITPSVLVGLETALEKEKVGGKAAGLGALIADGHRVPRGFVLPVDACRGINGSLPADLEAALAQALAALGDGPFAVRSSAVCEDGAEQSFAGQLSTTLGARDAQAVAAGILACVASARAPSVRDYQRALGGDAAIAIAVIVQEMVHPDAAGVAFTVNPATGDDEVVLNAVTGLGDKLVSGEVSPETWVIGADARVTRSGADVLDEATATAIADLARTLAERRGDPQDVEWAVAGGEIFLLQSRPITAAPLRPDFDDPTEGLWSKDLVHFPTPITPFGASTYMPALETGIQTFIDEFGLALERFDSYWRAGEFYGRAVPPGGKDGPPPPWWVLGLLSRLVPALRRKAARAREALGSGLPEKLARDWNERGRADLEAEIRALAALDLDGLDLAAQVAHLDRVADMLHRGQQIHFRLLLPWLLGTHRFVVEARALLGWSDPRVLALLAGASSTTTAPAAELAVLAERARNQDATVEADLAAWRARWGLRASAYDTGAPTLAEQPGLLDRIVEDAIAHPPASGQRDDLVAEARASLSGAARDRFDALLEEARRTFPLREDNVLYTDNLICGLARQAVLAVGRSLAARGQLDRPEDVVELFLEEIRSAARDATMELRARARRRKRERAWVAAHPGPDVLRGDVTPPPDFRGFPAALRTVNEAFMWLMSLEYPEMSSGVTKPRGEVGGGIDGLGAWPGTYTGPARVVMREEALVEVRPGDVLIAPITTPAWSVVFSKIGALVTDQGGALSHAAIVAREFGIPTVLNTKVATQAIATGQRLEVDGTRGTVKVLP